MRLQLRLCLARHLVHAHSNPRRLLIDDSPIKHAVPLYSKRLAFCGFECLARSVSRQRLYVTAAHHQAPAEEEPDSVTWDNHHYATDQGVKPTLEADSSGSGTGFDARTSSLESRHSQSPDDVSPDDTEPGDFGDQTYQTDIHAEMFNRMYLLTKQLEELGLPAQTLLPAPSPPNLRREQRPLTEATIEHQSARMSRDLTAKQKDPRWQATLAQRMQLPTMTNGMHKQLAKAIEENDVVIIQGEPGSGKSTQVPQVILDYATKLNRGASTNIVVSQPRRLSAVSLAERVAWERVEELGRRVGYHVRFDRKPAGLAGNINFCTTGIVRQYLEKLPESVLSKTSHWVIDEVHERSVEVDLVLLYLRDLVRQWRAQGSRFPKVIIMSATIDANQIASYFQAADTDALGISTAVVNVPGRTHDVTALYLEALEPALRNNPSKAVCDLLCLPPTDHYLRRLREESIAAATTPRDLNPSTMPDISKPPYQLAAAAALHVLQTTASGDILVFLDGLDGLEGCERLLRQAIEDTTVLESKAVIFKLHSKLPDSNNRVFDSTEQGRRRVILSTDIAEASITLPNIEHVIDTGTAKTKLRDVESGTQTLITTWISKQSLAQRKGRAGRVKPGHYYALFTESQANSFEERPQPDIRNADLTPVALDMMHTRKSLDFESAMAALIEPAPAKAIEIALENLIDLGALTPYKAVSRLGRLLPQIHHNPQAAKLVLLGLLFKCLEPMLIASAIDFDYPLIGEPMSKLDGTPDWTRQECILYFARGSWNSLIAQINAFRDMHQAVLSNDIVHIHHLINRRGVRRHIYDSMSLQIKRSCRELYDLRLSVFSDLKEGEDVLASIPLELNAHSGSVPLIKALLLLTLQRNLAISKAHSRKWFSQSGSAIPDSWSMQNVREKQAKETHSVVTKPSDFVSYAQGSCSAGSSRITMMQMSEISPLTALLFARDVEQKDSETLLINGRMIVKPRSILDERNDGPGPVEVVHQIMDFRALLARCFAHAFFDIHSYAGAESLKITGAPKYNRWFDPQNEISATFVAGITNMLGDDAHKNNSRYLPKDRVSKDIVWRRSFDVGSLSAKRTLHLDPK
jgi:ATP-dependent RNA helicase DHX36